MRQLENSPLVSVCCTILLSPSGSCFGRWVSCRSTTSFVSASVRMVLQSLLSASQESVAVLAFSCIFAILRCPGIAAVVSRRRAMIPP